MEKKILEIVEDTVRNLNYQLVESFVTFGKEKTTIKAIIYRNGEDMSHEDCTLVSKVLRKRLELEELFPDNSVLIVESPGVERKIKDRKEYDIFNDKEIRVIVKNPEKYGLKENVFIGKLQEEGVDWLLFANDKSELKVDDKDIAKANLYFDINKYL